MLVAVAKFIRIVSDVENTTPPTWKVSAIVVVLAARPIELTVKNALPFVSVVSEPAVVGDTVKFHASAKTGPTATPATAAPAKSLTSRMRLLGVAVVTWNAVPSVAGSSDTISQMGATLFCVTMTIWADWVSTARVVATAM